MPEETIVLGPNARHPRQRVNHIHVTKDRVALHDHPVDAEAAGGIDIPMAVFRRIWSLAYWKKPGVVEVKDEGGNLRRAAVEPGAITLEFDGGKEVVSTNALWDVVAVVQRWEDAERRQRMGSHNTLPPRGPDLVPSPPGESSRSPPSI